MPHRPLPPNPDIVHLRNQAHDLLKSLKEGDPAALQRIREFHPRLRDLTDSEIRSSKFQLSDACLTLAREYSFASWPLLKAAVQDWTTCDPDVPFVDRIADESFRQAVRQIDSGDVGALRDLLRAQPHLARQHVFFAVTDYFGRPGLLQFVAQNPIRQPQMPNAVEIATVILDCGPSKAYRDDTLGLVSTGCVPRQCGVQIPLIDLLWSRGARISSLLGVVAHGEFEAAEALLLHGAPLTLSTAAALGRADEFRRLYATADAIERHRAVAMAAQWGKVEPLRILIEEGEDVNRYNPTGAHAHSTPLHQAALQGHGDAVRLLLTAGARKDIPDTLWNGTAIGWAEHAGRADMIELLRG